MPNRLLSTLSTPILALGALLAACHEAEAPLAPTLERPQFSLAQGGDLRGTIVFESNRDGHFHVYIMNADGTGVTQLTFGNSREFDPVWSPTGQRIAVASDRDGNFHIYTMNADGTRVTQLTHNQFQDYAPAWSPDGKRIVFTSNRTGYFEVFIMNADGSGATQLTHDFATEVPTAWSPGGKRIAFTSNRTGNVHIYVMNPDGSGVTQLINSNGNDLGHHAGWSPDGRRFLFSSDRNGDLEIFVVNADGTGGVTQLTNNYTGDADPAWSPDGKQIAFKSTRTGYEQVFVMNADAQASPTPLPTGSPCPPASLGCAHPGGAERCSSRPSGGRTPRALSMQVGERHARLRAPVRPFLSRGELGRAEHYRALARERQGVLARAEAERSRITVDALLEPHDFTAEQVAALREDLRRFPDVEKAYLARRVVRLAPETPCHVLGIVPRRRMLRSQTSRRGLSYATRSLPRRAARGRSTSICWLAN